MDDQWENYCTVIKMKIPSKEMETPPVPITIPYKRKRQKRRVLLETSEEPESLRHDDSNFHSTEAMCKSPALSDTKGYNKTSTDKLLLSSPGSSGEINEDKVFHVKTLEERIRDLPEFPLYRSNPCHIHCDFCGHLAIIHDNHIDFLSDGELHYTTRSGATYPHKLAITNLNPVRCELLDMPDFVLDGDPQSKERCNSVSASIKEVSNLCKSRGIYGIFIQITVDTRK